MRQCLHIESLRVKRCQPSPIQPTKTGIEWEADKEKRLEMLSKAPLQ